MTIDDMLTEFRNPSEDFKRLNGFEDGYFGERIKMMEDAIKERDALRSALDDLMGLQNGPPMLTLKDAWNETMERAEAALEWKEQGDE